VNFQFSREEGGEEERRLRNQEKKRLLTYPNIPQHSKPLELVLDVSLSSVDVHSADVYLRHDCLVRGASAVDKGVLQQKSSCVQGGQLGNLNPNPPAAGSALTQARFTFQTSISQ